MNHASKTLSLVYRQTKLKSDCGLHGLVLAFCTLSLAGIWNPKSSWAQLQFQPPRKSIQGDLDQKTGRLDTPGVSLQGELVPLKNRNQSNRNLTEFPEYQFPAKPTGALPIVPNGRPQKFSPPEDSTATGFEASLGSQSPKRGVGRTNPQLDQLRNVGEQAAFLIAGTQEGFDGIESLPPPLINRDDDGENVIKQRYSNGQPRIIRHVAQDRNGNYFNHGPWEARNQSGQTIANGTFSNGLMDGQWSRIHEKSSSELFSTRPFNLFQGPFRSVAQFKNGKLNGLWTIYDRYRTKIFEIPYENGVRHGTATWFLPNNAKMREATFNRGLIDGEILDFDETEQVSKRQEYVEGRRIVKNTTFYRPNVKKTQEYFLDAKLEPEGLDNWWDAKPTPYVSKGSETQNGAAMSWFENGQPKKRGQYNNGQPVGQFTWWHANGNKQIEGFYVDGKKNRRWTWWHENGMKKFEGIYKDNQPVDIWRAWHANGELRKQKDYSKPKAAPPVVDSTTNSQNPASRSQSVMEPIKNPPLEFDDTGDAEDGPATRESTSETLPAPDSPSSTGSSEQELEQISPLDIELIPPADTSSESLPNDEEEIGAIPAELYQRDNNANRDQILPKNVENEG